MFKKLALLTVAVLSILSFPAQAWRNDEITMLVVPREVLPVQITQDISRRYPVMIVSYQLQRGVLKLHAWNGDNWVGVSVEDYTNGTFFAIRPKHAIIVEDAKFHAPEVLVPSSTWCESANRLTSTDPRAMIHLLGVYFDFPFRHWDQFAKRYGYSIEQINPTLKNVHWWNLRGDILLEKRAQRDFTVDLNKWYYLETLPAPAVESPVAMEGEVPLAPATPAVPVKAESATAVDITAKAPAVPAVEPAAAPQTGTPAAIQPADPFAAGEIPAAEVVVPQESKKHW